MKTKKITTTIIGLLLLIASLSSFSQVNIIFDTDFGGDADDLGALAMLNYFVDTKECNLLAVMVWSQEIDAVPAIDAVNTFYNHPNIPIGVRKGASFSEEWNYCKPIATALPYSATQESAPDAIMLYRQLLANSNNHSIVIVPVGPLANLKNLINSPADSISPLNGKDLMNLKVKEFVVMGGQFPSGENEWNFNGNMPGVTQFVLKNIEVPIIFSGFEVGEAIKTGKVFNQLDKNHPLYLGFMHFSKNASWIKENFKGDILDNSTFDQTAVLYAVRQNKNNNWELISDGICVADDKGGNTWEKRSNSKHAYLKLKTNPENLASYIESIMLHSEKN